MEKMQVIDMNQKAMKTFEDLSEEQQRRVIKKAEGLDYKDSSAIIQFGAEDAAELSNFSSNLFKGFNVSNFTEFDETITELMTNLNSVDTESLSRKNQSKWESFPIIGPMLKKGLIDSVNETIIRHTNIEKVIEDIITKLEQTKLVAIKDMKLASEMRKKAYDYADAQELNFLAVEKSKEAAEDEKATLESRYDPNNLRDVNELSDISNAITSLDRKAVAIQSYRLMSLQSLPKLTYIHNASQAIATKIEDIIINVIPQWRQQFSLAIFAFHIKNSAYVLENVRVATEEIYKQNGLLLKDAMMSTAKEIEALPVSIEALKLVNDQMISICDELVKIEKDAKEARKNAIPEIQQLQQAILDVESKSKEGYNGKGYRN